MKKAFFYLLVIIISISAYGQKIPKISFYLTNGDVKQYNLADIDDIKIQAGNSNYMLKIFYEDTLTENYLTKSIESIKFEKDFDNKEVLNIYMSGQPTSFILGDVDSINFFIPDFPIPEISGINPPSAKIGDEITINGLNFESVQGKSIVAFKGKNAVDYISWSDTQIKVKVPSGAQTDNLSVTVMGIKSNEVEFKVIPQIASLTPISGRIGDNVTVKGTGFGNTQGTSTIAFNGINGNVTNWSDSQILIKVPKGAKTGKVSVTSSSIKSNELVFTVLPGIENISPSSARIGDTIKITGLTFGVKRDSSIVSFTGKNAVDYISWSDTAISVKVPLGAKTGKVSATINKTKINDIDFSIIPTITKLTPDSAGVSEQILITGTGFGEKKGTVSFNDIDTTDFPEWSDIFIRVNVPSNVKSGKLKVTASNNKSNEVDYTIVQHIVSINPASAKVGELVTIKGTDFGSTRGTNAVYFNGTIGTEYQSWTETEIVVRVPDNASNGKVTVKINTRESNKLDFEVIPFLMSFTPASVQLGGMATIAGTGFAQTRGTSFVTLTGSAVNASDYIGWSANAITVKVPNGAKTGKVTVKTGNIISNELDYTVLPSITSISPTNGNVGDEITINGVSFGDSRGTSFVNFSSTQVTEYTLWTDTQIKVKVPAGTTTGNLFVTIGSNTTNQVSFQIKPNISGLSPTSGSVGDFITIAGSNFGATRGTNYVTFNTANATVYNSWSDNQIVAEVPSGTRTGKVSITVGLAKSNEVDFTINAAELESVTIGTQIWTLKNLDVTTYRNGDQIPECTSASEWANLTTGAWCYYNNDQSNNSTYGKLYNWYAVIDSRGLAPEGWHVPSNEEFSTLISYLGGNNVAGGKLKETGTSHWQSPNTGATNESGFTALPGGWRYSSGGFSGIGIYGNWWSSTEDNSTSAYNLSLYNSSAGIVTYDQDQKKFGFSVRLIKD